MEIVSYGRTRQESARDFSVSLILAYCRMRHGCGKGDRRCPVSRICLRHELGYLITDFTDDEVREALRLIAQDGGIDG